MFERIVVIVDGSETSQYAIGASITISREDSSPITFCLTVDPALTDDGVGGECFAQLATQMSRQMLDDALAQAEHREAPGASGRILVDEPVRGVVTLAREQQAGLIVLGIKPRIGFLRPFMRSLAEEVLRETMIPLCVVRRPARGRLSRRILVPIVDDDLSDIAVRYATGLARNFRSTLYFCAVEAGSDDARGARRALDRAKAYAKAHEVPAQELLFPLDHGIPNAIVRNADIHACDSIVMASHVREGLPRLIQGSVTEAVIYSSDVPVVIVRAASV